MPYSIPHQATIKSNKKIKLLVECPTVGGYLYRMNTAHGAPWKLGDRTMLVENFKEWRRQDGSLYLLNGSAFVHVYRNDSMSRAPISRLIAAYNNATQNENS